MVIPNPQLISDNYIEIINILRNTNHINSANKQNLNINNSIIFTKNKESHCSTIIRGKTPGVHQTNSTIRRSIFIKEETANLDKYAKINCKNSVVLDNHPTLNINDSEVVTAANLGSIANNMINGGVHTLIKTTAEDAKITIQTAGVNSSIEISSTGANSSIDISSTNNLTLSSQKNTKFEVGDSADNSNKVTIHNKDKGDLVEFIELNSTTQNDNTTDLTLNHYDVGTKDLTGNFKLSVGDKGVTTIKTVDSNTTGADLKVQVEGSVKFYDIGGEDDDINRILTIECADDAKCGLHLNRSLYLSYKNHNVNTAAGWNNNAEVPDINKYTTHFLDLNDANTCEGVILDGLQNGQVLHLFFDNTSNTDKTLKLLFGDGNNKILVSGGGETKYLIFSQSGQSAYLLWIESKWRIVNTGAALSNT
jgi:hypothetical protein